MDVTSRVTPGSMRRLVLSLVPRDVAPPDISGDFQFTAAVVGERVLFNLGAERLQDLDARELFSQAEISQDRPFTREIPRETAEARSDVTEGFAEAVADDAQNEPMEAVGSGSAPLQGVPISNEPGGVLPDGQPDLPNRGPTSSSNYTGEGSEKVEGAESSGNQPATRPSGDRINLGG